MRTTSIDFRDVEAPMDSAGACDCCGEITYNFEVMFGACVSDVLVVCAMCNGAPCLPGPHNFSGELCYGCGEPDYVCVCN